MKKISLTLLISAFIAQPSEADLVPGGDFQMYKPGTDYAVTATFGGGNSFARGVGDGIELAGGTVVYSDDSPDGVTGDGIPDIDMPGWAPLQSGNDLFGNGVDGSNGMNLFAAWGGDGRIQSAESLGTIGPGGVYTISAMVGGPDSGPIQGPLAFHLAADGVQLTPSEVVDPTLPNGGVFQEISRTYDADSIADHTGAEMTIVLGVEDANDFANRVVFDNVSLVATGPGPSFDITEIDYAPDPEKVTLTWRKTGAASYTVKYSTDLTNWDSDLDDGITADADENPDDGDNITMTFDIPGIAVDGRLYFRVEQQ